MGDGIANQHEDDRHGAGLLAQPQQGIAADEDHIGVQREEFLRDLPRRFAQNGRVSKVDLEVAALYPAQFAKLALDQFNDLLPWRSAR